MKPEQLAAIRDRVEKASPGPWESVYPMNSAGYHRKYYGTEVKSPFGSFTMWGFSKESYVPSPRDPQRKYPKSERETSHMETIATYSDSMFIAHARQDIPALLSYVEELEKKLGEALSYTPRHMTETD